MDKILIVSAALIFAFAFPLALLIWWKKKTGLRLAPFIVGAACFFVFAMVLESICHNLVLIRGGSYTPVYTNTLLYVVYGSFAAGIFEETGRLFGFKVLLKKYTSRETAVAYGIGHGGIECVFVLGATYLQLLLCALGVSFGDPSADIMVSRTLAELSAPVMLLACFERILAVAFHVGASMLVFTAARDRRKFWLYPAAIVLHALLDAPAALMQKGVITNMLLLEAVMAVISAAVLIASKKVLYSSIPASPADGVAPEDKI